MRSRPVGVLLMEDEAGEDEKIICVPTNDLHPFYCNVSSYHDLPQILLDKIAHFFSHYKDLEVGKWVKVKGWGEPQDAAERINAAIERARKEKLKSAL
jgi:inorganic pyrophosphatase